jgi:hypothetical protein
MHESKRRRLQLIERTLSAHSFNFYTPNLSPGTHTIHTQWFDSGRTERRSDMRRSGHCDGNAGQEFQLQFTARVYVTRLISRPSGSASRFGAGPFLDVDRIPETDGPPIICDARCLQDSQRPRVKKLVNARWSKSRFLESANATQNIVTVSLATRVRRTKNEGVTEGLALRWCGAPT